MFLQPRDSHTTPTSAVVFNSYDQIASTSFIAALLQELVKCTLHWFLLRMSPASLSFTSVHPEVLRCSEHLQIAFTSEGSKEHMFSWIEMQSFLSLSYSAQCRQVPLNTFRTAADWFFLFFVLMSWHFGDVCLEAEMFTAII